MRQIDNRQSAIPNGVAAIVALFSASCPSHISRLISSFVVDAINGMFRRGWITNMCVKSWKAFAPLFAHCYTLGSIERICFVGCTKASCLYTYPSIMDFGAAHAVGWRLFPSFFAKFEQMQLSFFQNFLSVTSTGTGLTASKVLCINPANISTFAKTTPKDAFTTTMESTFRWSGNKKAVYF